MSTRSAFVSRRLVKMSALLASAILGLSTVAALAQDFHAESAMRSFADFSRSGYELGATRGDRIAYDHSGTRGREGLGASPFHPEGPGDFTD